MWLLVKRGLVEETVFEILREKEKILVPWIFLLTILGTRIFSFSNNIFKELFRGEKDKESFDKGQISMNDMENLPHSQSVIV